MIIAAHNEEDSIDQKLDNVLSLDYPAEKFEVLVASDGSRDNTEAIVRRRSERSVRLLALPRVGKATALNQAVASANGEVLVFSDANSMYAPNAIRELVKPLADPRVGGVAGDQRYVKSNDQNTLSADGEKRYWDFDRKLKLYESQGGNVISATGASYAIRRVLFKSVPDGVTDDFVTSTRVISQGYRLVFAALAAAYEPVAGSSEVELGRKVRVTTRGLRGVVVMRELLNPLRYGFYSLQLASHKLLRRLAFVPLLAIFISSLALCLENWLYMSAAVVQLSFCGLAMMGMLASRVRMPKLRVMSLPFYFCLVNAACMFACWNLLRGRRIDRWEPQRNDTLPARRGGPAANELSLGSSASSR